MYSPDKYTPFLFSPFITSQLQFCLKKCTYNSIVGEKKIIEQLFVLTFYLATATVRGC